MEKINVEEIKTYLREFSKDRDWDQYHTPKNLACALSVEASELLEIFQWMNQEEENNLVLDNSNENRKKIEDEMSDILTYLIRLSDILKIDLSSSMKRKFQENEEKYPADQVRGSARKYNDY